MSIDGRFIGVAEASERLSVAELTVRRWIEAGRVPYTRIGDRVLIPLRWFAKLEAAALAEVQQQPTSEGGAQ